MDSLLEYTSGNWIMITCLLLQYKKIKLEWYLIGDTNMIKFNFKQNYLKKNSFIGKNTGWDKLRSRLTLSTVSVFPTTAVLHPHLSQPHQLREHRGA